MPGKSNIIRAITIALIVYFSVDFLYAVSNLSAFDQWIQFMPGIRKIHTLIKWSFPAVELLLILCLLMKRLLLGYYCVLAFQLTKIAYLFWAFYKSIILSRPYHTLWADPSWKLYVFFELIIAILSFIVIMLLEFKEFKWFNHKKALRKKPVEVH